MDLDPSKLVTLLVVAVAVAIVARRLRLPYTVGLVATGIGLAFVRIPLGAALTHDFIFDVILPPLLFEAAIAIPWRAFQQDALPVLTLSIAGVAISAAIVAIGMHRLLAWEPGPALVFGVLTAATDPVAVIALFKGMSPARGVSERLRFLVESESLLNDGVAAVFFALALAWAASSSTQAMQPGSVAYSLVLEIAGGLTIGLACGGLAIFVAGRTDDHLVETSITAAAAYGSFLLAQRVGASGVLATVACGVLIGNSGGLRHLAGDSDVAERGYISDVWEFAAFMANSMIFLIIGGRIGSLDFYALGWQTLGVAIALVILGRAFTVYPIALVFKTSRWQIPLTDQHVLWWGGLRGALALALALALPETMMRRDQIVVATFGIVAFSVLVQGLSMPLLLRAITRKQP